MNKHPSKARAPKNGRARKSLKKLFNPDVMVTSMHQFLSRDFLLPIQMYGQWGHTQQEFCYTQTTGFLKKYVSPRASQAHLERRTLDKFLAINQHMADYRDLEIPRQYVRCNSRMSARDRWLLRARQLVHRVLGDVDEDEVFLLAKHGTGSSIGVPYRDTSIEAKFTFPITCTPRVKPLLMHYMNWDTDLRLAVEEYNCRTPLGAGVELVDGSRATTVEKNDDIRRMIAVEPTGNMFFQQGLMRAMYLRMASFGLDVSSLPQQHKRYAWRASMTGKEATIDFSSASDCVSTELLRWLIPPKWFWWLDMVRSPTMKIGQQTVELNMFSTMGNATTFPLETLTFWAIAATVDESRFEGNSLFLKMEDLKSVSVFGDDCVVPTHTALAFIEACESVGFIVNKEKSFYGAEPFRESCGGDYLRGTNVRPFHLRAPTSDRMSALEPWLYTVLNRITPIYKTYFGSLTYVYEKQLFKYLFDLFRKHKLLVKVVPTDFPDDAGWKIDEDIARFNECYDIRFSKIEISDQGTVAFRYCRFVYREERAQERAIRYAMWLRLKELEKFLGTDSYTRLERMLEAKQRFSYKLRKNGGYIVAKGLTSFWDVPRLKPNA